MKRDDVPTLPIHLDSPMAINATNIYRRYPEEHGLEDVVMRGGDNVIFGNNVYLHKTRDESVRLNSLVGPRIIIASSGMMTGGRVLHHLRRLLPHRNNWIVLAGYQAPGTRGRRLRDGETKIRMHGRFVPVRARIAEISGLSAHADQAEILRWLDGLTNKPKRIFVNHGEPSSSAALAMKLQSTLGVSCEVPEQGEAFEL